MKITLRYSECGSLTEQTVEGDSVVWEEYSNFIIVRNVSTDCEIAVPLHAVVSIAKEMF